MANQDDHVINYYLSQGRILLAKASNRLMKQARQKKLPYHIAIKDVFEIEEGIKDLSKKIRNRKSAALRRS